MAVLQEKNQNSSSDPSPPPKNMKEIQLSGEKSSCLQLVATNNSMKENQLLGNQSSCLPLVTTSNVVNASANPMMPESNIHKRKRVVTRVTVESLYDSSQAQSSIMERAKTIEASLDPRFPALLKIMMPSQVTGGFCLGLPKKFRDQHLPKEDAIIVLEDENGKEFETKYLAEKGGLSGGWRGFSIAHKILQGDVVIFHLVTPFKFKVYIVRSNEVDCPLPLLRLDAPVKQIDNGDIIACGREERDNLEPTENNAIVCYTYSGPTLDQSENDSEDPGSESQDGLRLSESVVTFKDVKSLENFDVHVNGLIINSELSKYNMTKYYELCCSQNSFLHEHLLEGLNCKLIAGVISETINIADAIKTCKITTPEEYFSTWDRTLKAFGDLGMNVGFLHARLDQLASLASESRRFKEASLAKDHAEEEMRSSEASLLEEKEAINRLDKLELMFQEVARAPWRCENFNASGSFLEMMQISTAVILLQGFWPLLEGLTEVENLNRTVFSSFSFHIYLLLFDCSPFDSITKRSERVAIAVLQDKNQSSSDPPPSKNTNKEKLVRKKSSCLTESQMTQSIVVSADPMMTESHKRKRGGRVESLYDSSQAQSSVMERAEEVEASLDPKFPILLKVMKPSHVAGCFWLGLPTTFCCDHMPKQDTMIVLEDENGEEFETKYLPRKVGLSGGWRGFSTAHKLLEGDVVIFHLVTPSKFKVYIVRSNGLDEVDGALGLMKLDACIKQMDPGDVLGCERQESKNLEPIPEDQVIAFTTKSGPISDQSENDGADLGFEVLDGLRLSGSVVTFEKVKCMENFNVLVNGLNINAEFPKHLLTKYYELCCKKKSFLHEHLLSGLNCQLVSGVIYETINIADAIRASKITTSEVYFSTWDSTLKAFEGLGMNVGFLRARLDQLVSLSSKSKRFKEAKLEKDQAEEETRSLEAKLLEVKEAINMIDSEIETLNTSSAKLELMFQEVAKAPW